MASFDPSIISQIPDMAPNPVAAKEQGLRLADMQTTQQSNALKLNQQRQQADDSDRARNILKGVKLDSQEDVTKAAEKLSSAGLPDQAMQFMKAMQSLQAGKGELKLQQYQMMAEKNNIIGGYAASLVGEYDQRIQQGASPELAAAVMQPKYQQALQQLAQQKLPDGTPVLSPQDLQQIQQNPQFNPQFLRTIADRSKQGAAALQAQMKFHEDQLRDKREADQEARTDIQRKAEDVKERAEALKERQAQQKQENEDKAVDKQAQAIANYRVKAPTGYASTTPFGQKLMEKVLEIDPNYDSTRFDEKHKAVLAFATGPEGQKVRSLNVSIDHMDTLSQLGTALKNKDVVLINKLANWWETNVGGTAPNTFDAAKQIVADEINKAVVPGVGSAGERQRLADKASSSSSNDQLQDVIKAWKKLLSGQMKELRRQYRRTTGLDDFNDMLSPEAMRQFESESPQPTSPARPTSPPQSPPPAAGGGGGVVNWNDLK